MRKFQTPFSQCDKLRKPPFPVDGHICMHALQVITPKHCHIVAMGMTLLQLHNFLSST